MLAVKILNVLFRVRVALQVAGYVGLLCFDNLTFLIVSLTSMALFAHIVCHGLKSILLYSIMAMCTYVSIVSVSFDNPTLVHGGLPISYSLII